MSIWKETINLDILNQRNQRSMSEYIGIVFTEFGDDYLKARMPVDPKTRQPIGIMHGGASCVLAETIGSVGASFCLDSTQFYCVGLSINTNHIHSIQNGHVVGTGEPLHLGRSTHVWEIRIVEELKNKLISVTRLTLAVLTKNSQSQKNACLK